MKTIALISSEPIAKNMAGTAIRYFNLAKVLAPKFNLTLFSPKLNSHCEPVESAGEAIFKIVNYQNSIKFKDIILHFQASEDKLTKTIRYPDYLIAQNLEPMLVYKLKKAGVKIIFDLYAPDIIEAKELFKYDSEKKQKNIYNFKLNELRGKLYLADHILCASKRQIEFYKKTSNPRPLTSNYSILPFGIEDKPFGKKNNKIYQIFPNLKKSQKIILWGGGIWNWFDPLSLIEAIDLIAKKRSDIALVFMGLRHPNPKVPQMKMASDALNLAKEKKLYNKFVFFNFGWTPYEERTNFLTASHLGASIAFDSEENHYSFRTRDLDYFWAEIPTITTSGDVLSDLIAKNRLGTVVDFKDPEAIKNAIITLIDDSKKYQTIKNNIQKIKPKFYWSELTKQLEQKMLSNSIKNKSISYQKCFALKSKHYFLGARKKFL